MNKKIIFIILGLTLIATVILTHTHERTIIVLEDQKTGESAMLFPKDDCFELGYTHSVLLTPVNEFFEIIANNKLMLQKTVYESFGAGLPYEQMSEAAFEMIEGKYILYLNRLFDDVNMVISPIAKHTITVNGEVYFILDLFEDIKNTTADSKIEKYSRHVKIYAKIKKIFEVGSYRLIL